MRQDPARAAEHRARSREAVASFRRRQRDGNTHAHEAGAYGAWLQMRMSVVKASKKPPLTYIDERGRCHTEDYRSAEQLIRDWKKQHPKQ